MVNCVKNECYDPVSDRWEALEDTPAEFGHIHRSVAIIDDVAYLLGTYEGKEANTHYYYFKIVDLEAGFTLPMTSKSES